MNDDQLYEELLSFYSDVVLQIEAAIQLADSEREDPKKVQQLKCRKKSIHKVNSRS